MKGTFEAEVLSHVLATSKEKGTPSIKVQVEIQKNVVNGEPVTGSFYWDGWLTEKAFENTMKAVSEALGWNGGDLSELNGTGAFVGKIVQVVLEEEADDRTGKTHTKIKWLNPLGGGGVKALSGADAKAVADKLKGKVLAYRQKNPAAKPVDDDPFA